MRVLGLTGGSGSGKGFVSELFALRGVPSIDCDAVSRQVCRKGTPCLAEIASALGNEVLTPDGEYDRATTAGIVFSDREKLDQLNRITHRYILDACRIWLRECEKTGIPFAIIDAPVLYESGFDRECDTVIAVIASEETRIERICRRDGISEEMARLRLSKQKPNSFFRTHADFIIENHCHTEREVLLGKIDEILTILKKTEQKA